jgi:peroxiredoxin
MGVQGTKSDVTFLLVLLAVSLGANVYLARRLFSPPPQGPPPLAKGTTVSPLTATRLDGQPQTLSYAEKKTVLYVFTPSCPWCKRNLPNIKHLVATRGAEYRFIGISLEAEGLSSYVTEHQLPFPVYTNVSQEQRDAYHLGGVPQTLVISERGTVMQNWFGAYVDAQQAEIEKFFDVRLPGLGAPPPHAAVGNGRRPGDAELRPPAVTSPRPGTPAGAAGRSASAS